MRCIVKGIAVIIEKFLAQSVIVLGGEVTDVELVRVKWCYMARCFLVGWLSTVIGTVS